MEMEGLDGRSETYRIVDGNGRIYLLKVYVRAECIREISTAGGR